VRVLEDREPRLPARARAGRRGRRHGQQHEQDENDPHHPARVTGGAVTLLVSASIEHLQSASRNRLVLLACILGSVIVFVDSTVVNVALPALQRDLGGGLALQQWVVDAYLLTLGSLLLVGGSLGDLFGARRVFLIGIVSFGVMSVACAAAPDGTTLIAARGLQGIAGAILTPAGLAVIAATFSGEERGAAIGTWTAWTGVAFVVGPLVGGWLVTHASWRWIFVINVPFAIATAALVAHAVPKREPTGERPRVDVVGGALCVLGLGGPVFALIEEPRHGWGSGLILVPLVVGIALLVAFLWWERRVAQPMLPLGLFSRRNFSFANLETLAVYAGLSTLTFFLVLFVQQLAGYSALQAGFALLPITIVMFLLSPRVGRLSMRVGPRLFMGIGPLVAAAGVVPLARLKPGFGYWYELLPPLLLFSVGLSLIVAPLTSTVLADAHESDAGIASGVNNAVARVAGLLGIAVVGASIAGADNRLDLPGFRLSMAITAGLIAAGGLIGLAGIRNRTA
jgi:EmrB/QacA subfamily drug resistance transporter